MSEVEDLSLNAENKPQIDDLKEEIGHYQFTVKMSCRGCSGAVDRALKEIPEVRKYTINLPEKSVDVWSTMAYDDVLAAISKTGKEVLDGKELPVLPDDLSV